MRSFSVVIIETFIMEVHGRNATSLWMIVIPKGNGQRVISDELCKNAFVKVDIPTMKGEEKPGAMDLKRRRRVPLDVELITVGAVDISLMPEGARIVLWKFSHSPVS